MATRTKSRSTSAATVDLKTHAVNPWVLHAFGTAPQVTYPLGDFAAKTLGYKRMAIVAEDFTYGHEGAGGRDGAMARTVIHRAGGAKEVVPSKLVTTLRAGDRVVFETAGGGGYGDPARRDPQKVRADLADGKISTEGAEGYGSGRDGAG